MNKEKFLELVNKLIELGEDRDELTYWADIFDYLEPDKQLAIGMNLEQELKALTELE